MTAAILILLTSGVLWVMFMANGIAYGSIVGLPGREGDIRTLQLRAEVSLTSAVLTQVIGVSLIVPILILRLPSIAASSILRLTIPIAMGLLSSAFVFSVIKGF
jgi:hypothetical protein